MVIYSEINKGFPYKVPNLLRKKNVSSEVSRNIFFIDLCNDLNNLSQKQSTYNLIRSSLILRLLLIDKDNILLDFSKTNNVEIELYANDTLLNGSPFSNKEIRGILKVLENLRSGTNHYKYFDFNHLPLKKYNIEEFKDIICITFESSPKYCFSVDNVIRLISNKHGGSHLETSFDSTDIESFHFDRFNPFSMSNNNYFLEIIEIVSKIILKSLNPLLLKIEKKLFQYNERLIEIEVNSYARTMNEEEYKKILDNK